MKLVSEKEFRTETLGISATSFWRLKKSGDLPAKSGVNWTPIPK